MAMEEIGLGTPSGVVVPINVIRAGSNSKGTAIILPALGVRARFYKRFACELNAFGINTIILEQRGQGRSAEKPARRSSFGYGEYALNDLLAVINWCRKQFPETSLLAVGHSMGAHISLTLAALRPGVLDGITMVAAGTPFYRTFTGKERRQVRLLTMLMPALLKIFGHYPGHLFGFAGKEFPGIMRDWNSLARDDHFSFSGVSDDVEAALTVMETPVLCLSMEGDTFAPLSSATNILDRLNMSPVTRKILSAGDMDGFAGHFTWSKNAAPVAKHIFEWAGQAKPLKSAVKQR